MKERPVLLFGVTGSGKTEVYLQGHRLRALERGQTALVLVPEISSHAADRGTIQEPVRTIASERGRRAAQPPVRRASGTTNGTKSTAARRASSSVRARRCSRRCRSSGLIVVDEEHETSYKQEEAPALPGARPGGACAREDGGLCRRARQRDAVHRDLPQRHERQVRHGAA